MNTKIIDDTNPAFVYASSWFPGTWNASAVGQSGTLHSTNDQVANVMFTFPVAATAFSVFGIKRSRGGSYGICIDCDPNAPRFLPVDGFNATDNGQNPPVVLYSQTFSTPGVHRIILRNQADPRGIPPGNSQIALDRIELQVYPADAQSTLVSTPGAGLAPTTITTNTSPRTSVIQSTPISTSLNIGTTTNAPLSVTTSPIVTNFQNSTVLSTTSTPLSTMSISTNVQNSTSLKKSTTHVGPIVGGVLGALALIVGIFLLLSNIRFRAASKVVCEMQHEGVDSPTPARQWQVQGHGSIIKSGGSGTTVSGSDGFEAQTHGFGTAAAHLRNKTAHMEVQQVLETPSQSRRERDAGIVLVRGNDDVREIDTLPPRYVDVFAEELGRNQGVCQ